MCLKSPGMHYVLWRLGLASAQTQTTPNEQRCLVRHATGRTRLVEIGVWHGVNTLRLRTAMATDGVLFAIDPFPAGRFGVQWQKRIAEGEVRRRHNGTVVFIEMTSEKAEAHVGEYCSDPLDFIFIDGDHSYDAARTDWELWSPHVAIGGIVALHDSRSYPGRELGHVGATRVVQELVLTNQSFELVDEVDSLTVVRRRAAD